MWKEATFMKFVWHLADPHMMAISFAILYLISTWFHGLTFSVVPTTTTTALDSAITIGHNVIF